MEGYLSWILLSHSSTSCFVLIFCSHSLGFISQIRSISRRSCSILWCHVCDACWSPKCSECASWLFAYLLYSFFSLPSLFFSLISWLWAFVCVVIHYLLLPSLSWMLLMGGMELQVGWVQGKGILLLALWLNPENFSLKSLELTICISLFMMIFFTVMLMSPLLMLPLQS